jgi:AcrR family transcriptional regulator
VTTVSPSRRERLRTATVAEIRQTARRLLADGGPRAVSLRAIAREMGMTAPAIYRYFPSLDALVTELCTDLYAELSGVVAAARDRLPADDPGARLAAMARAFRRWAVGHRAEFALMFGEPIPGVAAAENCAVDAEAPMGKFCEVFITEFVALWQRHRAGWRPPEPAAATVDAWVAPALAARGDDLPAEVVHPFLAGWVRLYGLVAMEVFGHLSWALTDPEPLFESEIATFLRQLTG